MKALILNSGTGSRMGNIGTCKCLCLLEVSEGVSIVDEQLRRLLKCGITDICMTTGPYEEELKSYLQNRYPSVNFKFVHNNIYSQTNYIYSIFLAKEWVQEDILLIHGDLVFGTELLRDAIASPHSCMVTDSTKTLPEKDFKAVVKNSLIRSIGVEFFESALCAQPLYKLQWQDWSIWLEEICRFCQAGRTKVYAEDAFNNVSGKMKLLPLDAKGRMCFEIDNAGDLSYAREVYKQCK